MASHPPGDGHRSDGDAGPGRPPTAPSNGFGTAALVLGVLALLFFWLGPLAIVLGLIAIVLGVLGRGRVKNGVATNGGAALAGIVLGAIGLLLGVAITATVGLVAFEFGDDIRDTVECQEENAGDQEAIDRCLEDLRREIEQR